MELSKAEQRAVERHRAMISAERGFDVSFEESLADWMENCAQRWREEEQARMLSRQREEILRYKWIESEKAQRDLGAQAALDWIHSHAAAWRCWYEEQYEEELEGCGS